MKTLTILVIGGVSTVLFAPVIGYILGMIGCFLMLVGKNLQQFPGIF